jgi:hypothetical protein
MMIYGLNSANVRRAVPQPREPQQTIVGWLPWVSAYKSATLRLCILGIFILSSMLLRAQTNAAPENRFLVIVETSRAMEKRTSGLAVALDRLLGSGMDNQIRAGDTLGVWTYNDELHAGEFALQTWSDDSQKRITTSVVDFLAAQKFTKQPRFEVVSPSLEGLIKSSPFLTVIIFCSGTDDIRGTTFAPEINETLHGWRDEQQKLHMPFIVVLRVAQGAVRKFSVTPAPWKVELPPMPAPVASTKPTRPKPSLIQTSSVAPLIISGRKAESSVPPLIFRGSNSASQASLTNSAPAPAPSQASRVGDLEVRPTNSVNVPASAGQSASRLSASRQISANILTDSEMVVAARSPGPSDTNYAISAQLIPDKPDSGAVMAASDPRPEVIRKRVMLFGLIGLGLVIAVLVFRRSRANHVSLITHSIDRERE